MAKKKKKDKETKISSLSKEKALDDALRTRTFRKRKREDFWTNLLTDDSSAKGLANIKVEGKNANTHIEGISPNPNKLSRKERLQRAAKMNELNKIAEVFKKLNKKDKKDTDDGKPKPKRVAPAIVKRKRSVKKKKTKTKITIKVKPLKNIKIETDEERKKRKEKEKKSGIKLNNRYGD